MNEVLDQVKSVGLPVGIIAAVGVLMLIFTIKLGKFVAKLIFTLVAVGLIAAAIWWHLHGQ